MCLSSPSTPSPPPLPPAPPPPPTEVDPAVKRARTENRQRAALAQGRDSTILTSPQGLTNTPMASTKKSILGA